MFKEMTKGERLQYLDLAGFNTPCFKIAKEGLDYEAIRDFVLEISSSDERVSLRTYSRKEYQGKFMPNIRNEEAVVEIPKLLKEFDEVIVSEGIDPKDCLFCGNAVKKEKSAYFEVLVGSNKTVRMLANGTTPDVSVEIPEQDVKLKSLEKILYEILDKMKGVPVGTMLEFSYYDHPIGQLSQHLIFWEALDYA